MAPLRRRRSSALHLWLSFRHGNNENVANNKEVSRSQTFAYDSLNRLTSAQNTGTDCTKTTLNPNQTEYWGNSYGYDAWGNLTQKVITKCGAENLSLTALPNNQLSGYAYDAAGNMTTDPTDGVSASYDPENRIASATKGGLSTSYVYDSDGNRVEKTGSGTNTLYWYMTPGIVAESDLSGNLKSEYVFFNGERIARIDSPGNTVHYYLSDHLNSTSMVVSSSGIVEEESDYSPYGTEYKITSGPNHYKFTGKERDSESGLDYFGARYYASPMGRFITSDPIHFQASMLGNPQLFNLYAYAANSPLRFYDPTGEAIQLTGNAQSRQDQMDAICAAMQHQGCEYLYQNEVTTTDENGNKTTNYYVGIYTNGPNGDGPAFEDINDVTKAVGGIINDHRVGQIDLVAAGEEATDGYYLFVKIGPYDRLKNVSPGNTMYNQKDFKTHFTILASGPYGQVPASEMSNKKPGKIDLGITLGHEIGHGFDNPSPASERKAIDLENKVRTLKDPNAPTRNPPE